MKALKNAWCNAWRRASTSHMLMIVIIAIVLPEMMRVSFQKHSMLTTKFIYIHMLTERCYT